MFDASTRPSELRGRHLRVSEAWGEWEACAQLRRPHEQCFEVRRSTPLFMWTAIACIVAGLDIAFMGSVLPRTGLLSGAGVALVALPVFPIGRGISIDGRTRRIDRWWGWVSRPWFHRALPFESVSWVEIGRKVGFSRSKTGGRYVRHPLALMTANGKRILIKTCSWEEDARELGDAISALLAVPLHDATGDA